MRGVNSGRDYTLTDAVDIIPGELFSGLARRYRKAWRIPLCAVDCRGCIVRGRAVCSKGNCQECCSARAFSVQEALRWGEPTVALCPRNDLLWAIPLMRNQSVVGGLVATVAERAAFADWPPLDVRAACRDLRCLAEEANLTNASFLQLRRGEYAREQQRAYALHAMKRENHNAIRELYIREEPALFAAIRARDRGEARHILNRILVAIHHHAQDRLDLVKSHFLELVVTMCRTAVESGGAPSALLGTNYQCMTAIAAIENEEDLAAWFRTTLDRLMDAVAATSQQDRGVRLFEALAFMERHCAERISRDEVAQAVQLTPSHFSAVIKRETGVTFTELLNRMRVDRAAVLLARSKKPLAIVALECGFRDQAYFTNVFRRYRGTTPLRYRRSPTGRP